jgi:hypothetical protein
VRRSNRSTDDTTAPQARTLTNREIYIVKTWHESLNDGDIDGLVMLSHPNVEVGGPRGTGRGSQLLREWVDRANIRLQPRRIFHQAETVVVEQEVEWRSAETGQTTGSQTVASIFVVRGDHVTSVLRYDDLADALNAANLDESHEARSD